MVTSEQVNEILGEDKNPYKTENIDHDFRAISLLRERIPYDICRSIIQGADHDIIYLPDIDVICDYLNEEDLQVLADCNCFVNDGDYIALFV